MKRRNFLYSMFGMLATPFLGIKKAECKSFPVDETAKTRFLPHKDLVPTSPFIEQFPENAAGLDYLAPISNFGVIDSKDDFMATFKKAYAGYSKKMDFPEKFTHTAKNGTSITIDNFERLSAGLMPITVWPPKVIYVYTKGRESEGDFILG